MILKRRDDGYFDYKSRYGTEYVIRFIKSSYTMGNSLAIIMEDEDPEFKFWETYGTLTVNLPTYTEHNQAFIDINNMGDEILNEFVDKGWCRIIGSERSGYVEYPLVEFSEEFIDKICGKMAY